MWNSIWLHILNQWPMFSLGFGVGFIACLCFTHSGFRDFFSVPFKVVNTFRKKMYSKMREYIDSTETTDSVPPQSQAVEQPNEVILANLIKNILNAKGNGEE